MKILYAVTKGTWGGAQRHVFDLAAAAKKEGHDVTVLFGRPGKLKDECDKAGIRTLMLATLDRDINTTKEIKSFFTLIKILRKERPDVLHLHSPKMGGLGGLAGTLTGIKKIVYTVHGWPFNEDRSASKKFAIKLFSWITTLFPDTIIVLSEKEKTQVLKWPGVVKKLVVIPNGLSKIDFVPRDTAQEELVKESVPNKNIPWFGTIAELHKNKGLPYAIEALASLPSDLPWKYVIVGDGEEKKSLAALIVKHNLSEKIILAGFKQDARRLLKAFDIFIFPSIKEGFPYALLEAGQAGLPVITTRVGGIPELITEGCGILVEPKDVIGLTDAIRKLTTDLDLAHSLGKNLQQKVTHEYSLEKMVEKTFKTYR